jgi:myo-inositol-1(or 4)-monophosphatase
LSTDLALLTAAASDAADIALSFFGKDPQVWHKDAGAGPVTEADLAVDAFLKARLTAARPHYGWLSEETPDTPDRLSCDALFIVDPIDGTRAFIAGERTWGLSLAIATNGIPTAAVVLLPLRDKLYTAAAGQGAHLNGTRLSASTTATPDGATLLARKSALDAQYWPGGPPAMTLAGRSPMAYRLACLAEGRFDALYAPGPIWDWDLAGGALLVTESGHTLTTPDGTPWHFNAPHPRAPGALAANPTLHADLMARRTA